MSGSNFNGSDTMGVVTSAYGNALLALDQYGAAIKPVVGNAIVRVQEFWHGQGQEPARQWYLRLLDCYDALTIAGFHDHPRITLPVMAALEDGMESTWPAADFEQGCPELRAAAKKLHAAMGRQSQ